MADFSVADVKKLRERTGAGMMDAKKALSEAGGDIEAAVDALRAKGLATAQKKSSRTAAEGLVGVLVEVPVMLLVVKVVNESKGWYERKGLAA